MKRLNKINEKQKIGYRNNSLLILFFFISIGFFIRLYYIPFEVPISLDAIDYFVYSVAINQQGLFPEGYLTHNFGWSTFLSPIFSLWGLHDMLELINIQRISSSLVSVFTAIPIYFLCKEFFKKNIAVLGAILFLFDPRIIENSVLGISDPIFIFCVSVTIMFLFIKEKKFYYLSFVFVSIASFMRYEGILLIFPVLIVFFVRKDFKKKTIMQVIVGMMLFLLILSLIHFTAYNDSTHSSILEPFFGGINYVPNFVLGDGIDRSIIITENDEDKKSQVFINNLVSGYVKFLGWIMIPVLGFFIIPGIVLTKKKLTKNKIIFLLFFIFISLTSLYAFGRGIQETRYLYPLIPILILFACQFFDFLTKKFSLKNITIIVISTIIILSLSFLELDRNSNQNEIYDVTVFVSKIANGVNAYEGGGFLRVAELENSWPELPPINEKNKMSGKTLKFSTKNHENLEQFLKNNEELGLTHLVIMKNEKKIFLNHIFHNEKDYEFLKKIYDSKDYEFKNHIKIFEINYELIKFDL